MTSGSGKGHIKPAIPEVSTAPSELGDGARGTGQVGVAAVEVVWWRVGTTRIDHPRGYEVGWVCADGSAQGSHRIATPYRWLTAEVVEEQLSELVAAALDAPVWVRQAGVSEANPMVRLARSGHRVSLAEVSLAYGLDVVGGVVAQLRGRGVGGHVVVDRNLSPAVQLAAAEWAESVLDSFFTATVDSLLNEGWQQLGHGRWQLLAHQSGR